MRSTSWKECNYSLRSPRMNSLSLRIVGAVEFGDTVVGKQTSERSPRSHSSSPPTYPQGCQWPHDLHEQRSLHRKQLYEKLACFFESRNNRTYRKCFCDFSILFGEPIERLSDGFHDIMLPCPCGTCVSIMFFQQVIRLEEVLYEDFEIK